MSKQSKFDDDDDDEARGGCQFAFRKMLAANDLFCKLAKTEKTALPDQQ